MPKRISNGKGWLTLLFATTLLPQRLFTILDSAADCQDAAAFAGKNASNWVVVARRRGDLGALVDAPSWGPLARRARPQIWTDDFSNILSVLNWN